MSYSGMTTLTFHNQFLFFSSRNPACLDERSVTCKPPSACYRNIPVQGKFVAYYRVSTQRQGASGLGLEAQRKAVTDYLNGGSWGLIGELTEVETGKRSDRPQLTAALALCRRNRAKLVIAKLDRLSRNVAFIAT